MGDCAIEPEQDYTGKTGHQPPSHITQPQNIWPSRAPWWREGLYKYYNSVLPLAMKLVRIFALAFDLEETDFDEHFKFPITGMRPLYYPPMPVDEESPNIGLGAHSDFSCTSDLVVSHAAKGLSSTAVLTNRGSFGFLSSQGLPSFCNWATCPPSRC